MREIGERTLKSLLNEPQLRAYSVGVRRMSDALDDLDRLLGTSTEQRGLHPAVQDIDATRIENLRALVAWLRDDVAELAEALEVPPRPESVRAEFVAIATTAWTLAEDLRPTKLGGYGHVDPVVIETLSPLIRRIADRFLALCHGTRAEPADGGQGSGR